MLYVFQGCELDEELFALRRRGKAVKLEPKVFDVLLHLLRNRDRVVGKEELLRELWEGVVSESVLPTCIAAARRALGDDRTRAKVIQTVHGRGYRFVADVEVRSPMEVANAGGAPSPTSSFVGRALAMQRLREGLMSALAGRGRVLLLVGEPGIGKTRTAEEIADEARQHGARVLRGRCHEGDGAPAFWPWVTVLRAAVSDSDQAALAADMGPGSAEIADLVPELRERFTAASSEPVADDEQARFRLFDSVATFLCRASARRPIVIVLDDLHWADEASLRLLGFLAGEISEARLLLIGTYRDAEVQRGRPLARLLGALARESACERIALHGLEPADTAELVETLLGQSPGDCDRLASTVWEMTEGNPFFIQEVVGLLESDGGVESLREDGAAALALPQSVRDAIGRRLDALSGECNRLLRAASVIGREFSPLLLERVADVPRERLLELVEQAIGAGLLLESDEGADGYAFRHGLIRQTLYEEIETPERIRLHRRAGDELLEICGARPEPHYSELAHHFFEASVADDGVEAIRFCVLAAERARGLLAYEEAARQYERAVRVLQLRTPRDEAQHVELLLAQAEARWISGERSAAVDAFTAAAEIARQLQRPDLLARAAVGTRLYDMGVPPDESTRALIEEALGALGDGEPSLRSRLLARLVGMPPHSHSMERRDALSTEARELALQSGDDDALRDALLARRWACLGPDRVEERFEIASQVFALAERKSDLGLTAIGYDVLHGAHLIRGEIEQADRALAAYARVAAELRQPLLVHLALVYQGSRALARASFDEAERLIHEAYERGRSAQSKANFVLAGQMYFLRIARGDTSPGEERRVFFGEMMELPYSWAPAIRGALALTYAAEGKLELARREFEVLASRGFGELARDEHWLPTMGTLGCTAVALGDEARAAELYEMLEPYADLMMIHDLLRVNTGSASMVLGHLARLLGRFERAAVHFEEAIEREVGMDAQVAALNSKAGHSQLLQLRGAPGDVERSEALAEEVRRGRAAFGMGAERGPSAGSAPDGEPRIAKT